METKQSNNAGFHPPDRERWTSETSQDLGALPCGTKHQKHQRLVDRTQTSRTTTQERGRSLSLRLKAKRKHCWQWPLLCVPCSSDEVRGSHGSLGVDNRVILLSEEDNWTVLMVTPVWVWVEAWMMNWPHSWPRLFRLWSFCFHSGALYLNSSQNRALYSVYARGYSDPGDQRFLAGRMLPFSPKRATRHTCLPSSV